MSMPDLSAMYPSSAAADTPELRETQPFQYAQFTPPWKSQAAEQATVAEPQGQPQRPRLVTNGAAKKTTVPNAATARRASIPQRQQVQQTLAGIDEKLLQDPRMMERLADMVAARLAAPVAAQRASQQQQASEAKPVITETRPAPVAAKDATPEKPKAAAVARAGEPPSSSSIPQQPAAPSFSSSVQEKSAETATAEASQPTYQELVHDNELLSRQIAHLILEHDHQHEEVQKLEKQLKDMEAQLKKYKRLYGNVFVKV